MTPMVATADTKYAGKQLQTGDKFLAEDAHVPVLEHAKLARRDAGADAARRGNYSTRVIEPQRPGTPKNRTEPQTSARTDIAPSVTKGRRQSRKRKGA